MRCFDLVLGFVADSPTAIHRGNVVIVVGEKPRWGFASSPILGRLLLLLMNLSWQVFKSLLLLPYGVDWSIGRTKGKLFAMVAFLVGDFRRTFDWYLFQVRNRLLFHDGAW